MPVDYGRQIAQKLIDDDTEKSCRFCNKNQFGVEFHDYDCVVRDAYVLLEQLPPHSGKYNVHVYAVVRVKVCNVPGESQLEAIEWVEKNIDYGKVVYQEQAEHPKSDRAYIDSVEYGEEDAGFMVDEIGDENFSNSKHYTADKKSDLSIEPKKEGG